MGRQCQSLAGVVGGVASQSAQPVRRRCARGGGFGSGHGRNGGNCKERCRGRSAKRPDTADGAADLLGLDAGGRVNSDSDSDFDFVPAWPRNLSNGVLQPVCRRCSHRARRGPRYVGTGQARQDANGQYHGLRRDERHPRRGRSTATAPATCTAVSAGGQWRAILADGTSQVRIVDSKQLLGGPKIARLQAPLKPADALLAAAVRERVGDDVALRLALETVVANRSGGFQRFLDVTHFKNLTGAVGMIGPYAGQIIGLQLQSHGEPVSHPFAGPLLSRVDFIAPAELILHVVAHFVGNYISSRKIAGRPKSSF